MERPSWRLCKGVAGRVDAAKDNSGWSDQPSATDHRLFPVHGLDPQQRQELTAQFDSVLAFADFCTFLTAGGVGDRADRLVDLAQALYSETTEAPQRGARHG
jgi:hypothetical protein